MAFLNGTFLGISTFQNQNDIPIPPIYSTVKFYGGNVIIDKVKIVNRAMTNAELLAINILSPLVWSSDMLLGAEFNGSLDGGSLQNVPGSITGWNVYRQENDSNVLKLLNSSPLDSTQLSYIDYSCQSGRTYSYEVFPLTTTAVGSPLVSSPIVTDFYGYYLCNKDGTDPVYRFDLESQPSDYQIQESITTYQNYTKFDAYSVGKRNFYKVSVSAIYGFIDDIDGLIQTPLMIEDLHTFIQNGKIKYFKDKKNNLFIGMTRNFKYSVVKEGLKGQPVSITFDFEQSADE